MTHGPRTHQGRHQGSIPSPAAYRHGRRGLHQLERPGNPSAAGHRAPVRRHQQRTTALHLVRAEEARMEQQRHTDTRAQGPGVRRIHPANPTADDAPQSSLVRHHLETAGLRARDGHQAVRVRGQCLPADARGNQNAAPSPGGIKRLIAPSSGGMDKLMPPSPGAVGHEKSILMPPSPGSYLDIAISRSKRLAHRVGQNDPLDTAGGIMAAKQTPAPRTVPACFWHAASRVSAR